MNDKARIEKNAIGLSFANSYTPSKFNDRLGLSCLKYEDSSGEISTRFL